MKILLTNDDGYTAPGIRVLMETLQLNHDVILAAPDREKSAVGHGITLHEPIRINKIKIEGTGSESDNGGKNNRSNLNGSKEGYAIAGTPADCVKLGLFELCTPPPDLVISGINPGSNTGININYSGTVGAAREAALNGIASIAVSIMMGEEMDFAGMSGFIASFIDKIDMASLPSGTFLNINAPAIPIDKVRGVKITRQASNNLSKRFEKRTDPKDRSYYWYGRIEHVDGDLDTDLDALSRGYISLTPIQCDITDYKTMARLAALSFS